MIIYILATAINVYGASIPNVEAPGGLFTLPERKIASDGPKIFEHSQEAGPDQSFFVVGEGLTEIAYHVSNGVDFVVLRRNHAYFWYPASISDANIAFQFDVPGKYYLDQNSVEGSHGTYSQSIKKEKHIYREER